MCTGMQSHSHSRIPVSILRYMHVKALFLKFESPMYYVQVDHSRVQGPQ